MHFSSKSGFSKIAGSLAIPVIVVVPLILFWALLFAGRVLYWGTPILQFYEWRLLAVEAYRAGHFPLWTQMLGCGAPLLANLQSAALYPLNLIYFIFPIEQAMGYSVVIHVILAGLFMYGFARQIGLGRLAGLIASLSYMLSGFLIGRAQFLSMANAAPWFPLLFWLTYRVIKRRHLSDMLLLGIVIAVQLLAGHAQLWFYSLWAIGLYVLFLSGGQILWALRIGRPLSDPDARMAFFSWALIIAAVVIGLLAAAGQILPSAEMTHFSQRTNGIDYDFAMNYSFWPWRLITFFSPDFFGNPAHGDFWGYGNYWEDCGYIGFLPLLLGLAAVAIWLRRRRKAGGEALGQVPFFAILGVVALLLATGKNLPIYPFVWRHAPGFGFFQAPSRLLYWYTFGIAILAGIGLQYLGTSERWARLSRYLIAISLSLLLTVGLSWIFLAGATKLTFLGALTRTAILAAGSGALILINTRWKSQALRNAWSVLVTGFVVIDLLIFGWPLNPTTRAEAYHLVTDSGSFLREESALDVPFRLFSFHRFYNQAMFDRFFSFKDFGPTNLDHLRELRETLFPNLPVIEDLDSANNYDPLVVGNHQVMLDYIEELPQDKAFKLLGLMNVGYIAGDRETTGGTPVYSGEIDIFKNPAFLPRAFVVYKSKVISNDEEMLEYMASDDFDPSREVLLSSPGEVETVTAAGEDDIPMIVVPLRYETNSTTIDVVLNQHGYLVLSDTFYPSWHVWVNGEERPLLRANYNFRAVALPPGEHEILIRYQPSTFKWGMWIGGFTWLCVIAGWIIVKRREQH